MAKVATSITIDSEIKSQAQELLADLGLDLSTAVNIFLRQTIRENAIPFVISRDIPNDDTAAAIDELEYMKRHPEKYKSYSNVEDMMEDILKDV